MNYLEQLPLLTKRLPLFILHGRRKILRLYECTER